MSFLCSEDENLNISDNYYTFLKFLYKKYIKYITHYKEATSEYIKKLSLINEKYTPKLSKVKEEFRKNSSLNYSHIIAITSLIPRIINQQIFNGDFFIKGIDNQISVFEKYIREKTNSFNDIQNSFKETKSELIKKYKENEKYKLNFITNISNAEDNIYKYFLKQNTEKSFMIFKDTNLDKLINQNNSNKKSNSSLNSESINNSIQKAKKAELEYKNNLHVLKAYEEIFIESSKKSLENTRRLCCELSKNIKENVCDCLIKLKSYFRIPLCETDTYLNETIKLDEYSTFNDIILNSYKNNKLFTPLIPEKYTPKFFKRKKSDDSQNANSINSTNNTTCNSSNSLNESLSKTEDGFQEMNYIEEEDIFLTIKKLTENFELLDKNDLDLNIEEKKLRCKYLTLKILSFAHQNKINKYTLSEISENEIEELDKMFEIKYIRTIFLQRLSEFRTKGVFDIPEKEYNILGKLSNTILKISEKEKDYNSVKNIIILCQTYYTFDKNKNKQYLLNFIIKNEIFKSKNFWEEFVNFSIQKELFNSKKEDEKNGIINKEGDKETETKISNVVFSQLVPLTNNMIEFEVDISIIEDIIIPYISKYKIGAELSEVVTGVIESRKLELGNKNDNI